MNMSQCSLELVPYAFLVFGCDSRLQGFNEKAKTLFLEQQCGLAMQDAAASILDLQGSSLVHLAKAGQVKHLRIASSSVTHEATVCGIGQDGTMQYSVTFLALSKPEPVASSPEEGPSPNINSLDDILVKLEDARNPSPSTLRVILDEMPHSIFTSSRTGELSFINKQFFSYTGLEGEQAYDMPTWFTLFHPEDVPAAVAGYQHAMSTGEPLNIQYRIKRADGVWRWNTARGTLVTSPSNTEGFWVCSITDIEDLVAAKVEIRERKERMHALLDEVQVLLIAAHANDLRITFFEGSTETANLSRENTLGRYLPDLWPEADFGLKCRKLIECSNSEIHTDVFTTTSKGESKTFRYKVWHTPAAQNGTTSATVNCIIQDITATHAAQEALERSNAERSTALASEHAAKEANLLKTMFVSNVSHEIRTPISIILAAIDLLLADQNVTHQQKEIAESAAVAGQYLLSLISEVLDMGRIESGKLELDERSFNLVNFVNDVNSLTLTRKDLPIEITKDSKLYRGSVVGDTLRLNQILSNLLGNAMKFCPQGKIQLAVRQEWETASRVSVCFCVTDQGIGIPEIALKQIFEPFRQASSSTTRAYGGFGLGLALVRNLTELMGGTVNVQSKEGVGSQISITIPFAKDLTQLSPCLAASDGQHSVSLDRTRIRILVAEDNNVLRNLVVKMLSQLQFNTVKAVENGAEAVAAMEEKRYDLCLFDLQMPIMDGYEATRLIRQSSDPFIQKQPIVALTASAVKGTEEECLAAGFSSYISKPLRLLDLESVILRHVS